MKNAYELEEVDYESITVKKPVVPESSRKITDSKIRGTTIVNYVVDKNYDGFVGSNGNGTGIE